MKMFHPHEVFKNNVVSSVTLHGIAMLMIDLCNRAISYREWLNSITDSMKTEIHVQN